MLHLNRISQNSVQLILQAKSALNSYVRKRSHLFSLGEIKRPLYAQLFPTVLVKPNGSTIRINYHEPIAIINLPFDLATLKEEDRRRRILKVSFTIKTILGVY